MDWTPWQALSEPSKHWEPAAYQFRLISNGSTFPINRLLGCDSDGLMVIGESSSMERRRSQFCRGFEKGRGHTGANLLHLLMNYSKLKAVIVTPSFEYRFTRHETKASAVNHEAAMIRAYVIQFGELPPLNSVFPDRYGEQVPWQIGEEQKS